MNTEKLACSAVIALVLSGGFLFGCSNSEAEQPAPLQTLPATDAPPVKRTDSAELATEPATAPPPASLGASSGDADAGASADASADAAPPPAKKDTAACIAACEAKYPNGTLKARAIDKCWADNCAGSCPAASNQLFTAANGSCQAQVWTPSAACSQCTVDACCWAWDGCFGDNECKALNDCASECWKP